MKHQESNINFFSIYNEGFYKIYVEELQVEDLVKKVYNYKKQNPQSVEKSNRGGWQSTDNINIHSDFAYLTHYLNDLYFQIYKNPNHQIKEMWINISSYGDSNDFHHHGFNPHLISGVVYLKTPENSGEIEFRSNLDIGHHIKYYPIKKEILLFPQTLPHQVKPNLSQEDRISIAFNYG